MNVQIENVKLPIGKKRQRDNERRKRIFKNYADAYEAVHVRRPSGFSMTPSGNMRLQGEGEIEGTCASEKRMKELTKMLRNRRTL